MLIPKTPEEPTLNDIQLTWLLLSVELMRLEKLPRLAAARKANGEPTPLLVKVA
jgi:hypothetical protein